MPILKRIAAVFIGIMVAVLLVTMAEKLAHAQYTIPEGIDPKTPEGAAALIAQAPFFALLTVVLGFTLGTFTGALAAQLISNGNKPVSALLTGAILLMFVIVNLMAIPHPWWMVAASVVLVPAAAWMGGTLVLPKKSTI